MAVMMMAGYAVGLIAATAVVWAAVRRRPEMVPDARLVPVIRAARRRAIIALLFAGVVFVALAVAGTVMPELLGRPFVVAPLVAGAAGLVLYAATPPRLIVLQADETRSARLMPRSVFSSLSTVWARVFLIAVAALVVLLVFGGITADVDDAGRSRTIRAEVDGVVSWASPYPGWYYGVPTLVALAILVVGVLIALHRISATPTFPQPADADIDERWRRGSLEVMLKLGAGSVLFSFGGTAVTAGLAMGRVGASLASSVMADVLMVVGAVALVLSIISVALAGLTAVALAGQTSRMRSVR